MTQKQSVGLGSLKLPLWLGSHHVIYGGPYKNKPEGLLGVKMAQEIRAAAAISIPTRDFSVPDRGVLDTGMGTAVRLILAGHPLYVGCMGGRGRTGLFLALLAKAFGVKDPVEYVRSHYYSHAVETEEQYEFVKQYAVPAEVAKAIRIAQVKSLVYFRKNRTKSLTIA